MVVQFGHIQQDYMQQQHLDTSQSVFSVSIFCFFCIWLEIIVIVQVVLISSGNEIVASPITSTFFHLLLIITCLILMHEYYLILHVYHLILFVLQFEHDMSRIKDLSLNNFMRNNLLLDDWRASLMKKN